MNPDVSGYYTCKSRNAIQHSCNKEWRPYAFRMDFGTRLRDARNDAGLTGEKLGEMLGVSKQTIAHWEANRYEPKLVYLANLCERLGVSADYLLTGRAIAGLSPAAVKQARFWESLTPEEKRKWEAAKMLIREEGKADRPPRPAEAPMNMGESPIHPVNNSETPDALLNHPDTLTRSAKHLQLSVPGTGKRKGVPIGQSNPHTDGEPSERGEHAPGSPTPSRTGRA